MQALKESAKGIEDALRDMSASLRQYHGTEELTCLMRRGKLSILEAFGEFKKSNDKVYDARMESVERTRLAMLRISKCFEMLTSTISTFFLHMDELFLAFQNFSEVCDGHMELGDEKSPEEKEFNVMRCASSNMHALNQGLFESININCVGIQSAVIKQLEEKYAEIKCDVRKAKTDFDLHRRKVQVREADLVKAGKNLGLAREIVMLERELEASIKDLQVKGNVYQKSVETGMEGSSFVLEQASVTTWAASNILFLQLSNFFGDIIKSFDWIAGALASIKNNRAVSTRINSERQNAIMAFRNSLEDTSNINSLPNCELFDTFSHQVEAIAATSPRTGEDEAIQSPREAISVVSFFDNM